MFGSDSDVFNAVVGLIAIVVVAIVIIGLLTFADGADEEHRRPR